MKVFKFIFSFLLTIVLCAIGFVAGVAVDIFYLNKFETETYVTFNDSWVTDSVITDSDLSIHFLELGNQFVGDCVYIKCGDNDILIDAGSRNDSATRIIEYVDNFVDDNTLEYVIATHAHEDHIAGFYDESGRTGIFSHYKVETIIDFSNTNKTNVGSSTVIGKYYTARDAEINAGATHYTALDCYNNKNGASRTIQLSDTVELEVLYNYYYDHSYSSGENNFSVCVMLNQGDNHYLFTGDLEETGEKKLVTYYKDNHGGLPKCTLYKAGHHGSGTSSCPELLKAIEPDYICICSCAGTSEYTDNKDNQFPYQSFIDNVAPYTDKVFVTTMVDNYVDSGWSSKGTVKSMNGDIVCYFKNDEINFRFSNNGLLLKDTDWFKENRVCPDDWKK